MKFDFANTRLYVNDYDRCLEFYRDILGLEVAMVSQVDRYVELTKGVEIVSQPWDFRDWGVKLALVRDPEGNLVELLQVSQMVGAE